MAYPSGYGMPAAERDDARIRAVGVPVAWLAAVAAIAVAALVYGRTWQDLFPVWLDTARTTYTHGLLVVAITLWLLWRTRRRLVGVPVAPAAPAILVVLALSLIWLVGEKSSLLTVYTVVWPPLALAGVVAACGWRVARVMAFPLAFMWFSMPAWDYANRALQSLTVVAVSTMNHLTDVPAQVAGDLVSIPQGTFHIAAGCSGLHFFIVALVISTLAGEIHRDRLKTRLLLVGLAVTLAILANWIRVYSVILSGYLTDMQSYLVTVDHYKFGWAVFAIAMSVFFLVLRSLPSEAPVPVPSASVQDEPGNRWRPKGLLGALFALAVLPAASQLLVWLHSSTPVASIHAPELPGYSGPLEPSPAWRPVFVGPDSEVRAAYMAPDGLVMDFYANQYVRQVQGRELIGWSSHVLDPAVFPPQRQVRGQIVSGKRRPGLMEVSGVRPTGEKRIVLYYYDVDGHDMTGNRATQVAIGVRSTWRRTIAGIRAASARCTDDCDAARRELETFLYTLAGMHP